MDREDAAQIIGAVASGFFAVFAAVAEHEADIFVAVDPMNEDATVFDAFVAMVDMVKPVAGLDGCCVGVWAGLFGLVDLLALAAFVAGFGVNGIDVAPATTGEDDLLFECHYSTGHENFASHWACFLLGLSEEFLVSRLDLLGSWCGAGRQAECEGKENGEGFHLNEPQMNADGWDFSGLGGDGYLGCFH